MKDTFYFPHDYHARFDPKMVRLRMEIGPVGDGLYWDIVEMLYEEGGYLGLKDIPLIAKIFNTTEELVEKVVKGSELFIVNGDVFYSESLLRRLKGINKKRYKARVSANKRWSANAMPTHSERNAIKESKVKESKVKESKVKKVKKEDKIKYLEFVFLSSLEHQKLLERFGEPGAKARIENLNLYAAKIGEKKFKAKYVSHYATILSWENKNNSGDQNESYKRNNPGDNSNPERGAALDKLNERV